MFFFTIVQQNDGQVARRSEADERNQANRKVAEKLMARSAEKEYMRLLADAKRHVAEGNYRPAEVSYRKAIALTPGEPCAYFNLGCICGKYEGREAEAAHNYLRAATAYEALNSEGCVEWANSITWP